MNHTLSFAHTLITGKNRHAHTLNTVKGPDSPEMSRLATAKPLIHTYTKYT